MISNHVIWPNFFYNQLKGQRVCSKHDKYNKSMKNYVCIYTYFGCFDASCEYHVIQSHAGSQFLILDVYGDILDK